MFDPCTQVSIYRQCSMSYVHHEIFNFGKLDADFITHDLGRFLFTFRRRRKTVVAHSNQASDDKEFFTSYENNGMKNRLHM